MEAGRSFAVDGAIQLDDHGGREWLVVRVNERAKSAGAADEAAAALLPEPTATPDRFVLEITRGSVMARRVLVGGGEGVPVRRFQRRVPQCAVSGMVSR